MKSLTAKFVLVVCVSGVLLNCTFACDEGMVRDAAFDQPRDAYRLCVISPSTDPTGQTIAERLAAWLETTAATLNLEVTLVESDDPEVQWSDYGLPGAPPELPVVVLVGKRPVDPHNIQASQDFFVDYWQPEPTIDDLETLFDSPAREALRRELVRNLAVIVQVPESSDHLEGISSAVAPLCQDGFGEQTWGISSMTVDRHDPRERLLLSFLGIRPEGPDWVGVVFGRGKFMAPLEGEKITAAGLKAMLATVAADCTCTQSPSRLGVDLLMPWKSADSDAVVRLAPDPTDVVPELASTDESTTTLAQTDQWGMSPMVRVALWLFGGLIVVSGIGSVAIVWFNSHRGK